MTHTPGPWQSMTTDAWVALNGNQPSSICHVGDFTIATSEPSYEFHGTDEDDARLIAAAPDLLEALRDFLKVSAFKKTTNYTARLAFEKGHAAITKATGEQSAMTQPTQAQIDKADKLAVQIVTLVYNRISKDGKLYAYDGIEAAREIRAFILKVMA